MSSMTCFANRALSGPKSSSLADDTTLLLSTSEEYATHVLQFSQTDLYPGQALRPLDKIRKYDVGRGTRGLFGPF